MSLNHQAYDFTNLAMHLDRLRPFQKSVVFCKIKHVLNAQKNERGSIGAIICVLTRSPLL